jgi:hypothetical protein
MQMRIDGRHPIESAREELSVSARADRLALVKRSVLAHVREIGSHETDICRSHGAYRVRGKIEGQGPSVRVLSAAHENHAFLRAVVSDSHERFAIRKTMDSDVAMSRSQRSREVAADLGVPRE